jgi:hypothetical protein
VPTAVAKSLEWADAAEHTLDTALTTVMESSKEYGLHAQTTEFMGRLFRHFIQLWGKYIDATRPLYPAIANLLFDKFGRFCGVSMIVAACRDVFGLMTMHLYYFYIYTSFIYTLHLRGISALSRLFRGKRWNPLRERIDDHSYHPNEIVIGTVFFAVALLCYPVSLVYHVLFLLVRLVVLATHVLCGTAQLVWHCTLQWVCTVAAAAATGTVAPSKNVLERYWVVPAPEPAHAHAHAPATEHAPATARTHNSSEPACAKVEAVRMTTVSAAIWSLGAIDLSSAALALYLPELAKSNVLLASVAVGRPAL